MFINGMTPKMRHVEVRVLAALRLIPPERL